MKVDKFEILLIILTFVWFGVIFYVGVLLSKESNFNNDTQGGLAIISLVGYPLFIISIFKLLDELGGYYGRYTRYIRRLPTKPIPDEPKKQVGYIDLNSDLLHRSLDDSIKPTFQKGKKL